MNDAVARSIRAPKIVDVGESVEHLARDVERNRNGECFIPFRGLLQHPLARGAVDVFRNEQELAVLFPEVDDAHDVRMLELTTELRFSAKHPAKRRAASKVGRDALDGKLFAGLRHSSAPSLVDYRHPTSSDHLVDLIRTVPQRRVFIIGRRLTMVLRLSREELEEALVGHAQSPPPSVK